MLSPHELKKLLKRYGVEVEELRGVEKAEFLLGSKKIVVLSPQVVLLKARGQVIYQVIGSDVREESTIPSTSEPGTPISEDDLRFIMEHAGVSREKALEALLKAKGDIARAMLILRGELNE